MAPGAVWWRSALGMCTVYPTPVPLDSEPPEERSRGRAEAGRPGSPTEGPRACGVSPRLRVCLLASRRSVFRCQPRPRGPWSPPCRVSSSPCGHRRCASLLHTRCCTYETVRFAVSGTRRLSLCGAPNGGSLRTSEACACRFCQSARALLGGQGEAEGCCCDTKFPPGCGPRAAPRAGPACRRGLRGEQSRSSPRWCGGLEAAPRPRLSLAVLGLDGHPSTPEPSGRGPLCPGSALAHRRLTSVSGAGGLSERLTGWQKGPEHSKETAAAVGRPGHERHWRSQQ